MRNVNHNSDSDQCKLIGLGRIVILNNDQDDKTGKLDFDEFKEVWILIKDLLVSKFTVDHNLCLSKYPPFFVSISRNQHIRITLSGKVTEKSVRWVPSRFKLSRWTGEGDERK